jgi:hypothetical protein
MESILTNEEKKILRYISKYLISVGMKQGYLETESFDEYDGFDFNTLDVREWTHFANNYSMEVPSVLYPILEKILPYAEKKFNSLEESDYDANYSRIDFIINTKTEEISCNYWFTYYGVGDGVTTTYNSEEDESLEGVFEEIMELDVDSNIIELDYNGSGDSGYIESNFRNGNPVPASIEDYCYRMLENLHGGWEINEGSQGKFIFDLDSKEITLEHQYNTEDTKSFTLFEENFSK